ncbi:hypothetical protein [Carbonactinospora thermoautotrophica]|uniref:hypothetical protein n=1 Tax=Carbonactinospora thermoautotrophica TaxID=1469144 RepID=UPI000AC75718|nr:hypothetical protein [Carbonactinospora thermoautotrophica]
MAPGDARIHLGEGTFLNLGVMVAALELVEIGDRCVIGADSVVTTDTPPGVVAVGPRPG